MAIILVEQYFEFARRLADSIAVFDRGQVVMSGPIADLDPAEIRTFLTV